jgi:peptidoglycan/xylan/chitin deacetylase (PgdA/CDA1 family)
MHVPGLARMRATLRRFLPRPRPAGLILLYHRVAAPATDPQLLSVSPRRFAEHMAHLTRHFDVVGLHELAGRRTKASNGTRMVAVTFDDGYADNLSEAKPILESRNVPATVFVSTAALESGSEMWWDELERLLLHPSSLPTMLVLDVDGQRLEWDLGGDASYTLDDFSSHRTWNVLRRDDPTQRHRLYRSICRLLKPMTAEARERTLFTLRASAAAGRDGGSRARMLTQDDLRCLASGSLVDIGAHTVSHPVLAGLPLPGQRREISASKQTLEAVIGKPVSTFAYPYGTRADYTRQTASLVKEEGFALACANYPETVTAPSDAYQLPRFVVRNWTGDEFAARLAAWWEGREEEESGDR